MNDDDLPPGMDERAAPSFSSAVGKGAGAMLWIVILFVAVSVAAYFSTTYWSGPVPPPG